MCIWQISMSASYLGSARTQNASTPKEVTGVCAKWAICLTLKARTASVSVTPQLSNIWNVCNGNLIYPLLFSADKAVSHQKALCYRSVSAGTCSVPVAQHITKQICCCSRVGKAWGAGCDRCPLQGSGTLTKTPPVRQHTIPIQIKTHFAICRKTTHFCTCKRFWTRSFISSIYSRQKAVDQSAASHICARLLMWLKNNHTCLEWRRTDNIRVFIFWRLHNSGSQLCVITLILREKHR